MKNCWIFLLCAVTFLPYIAKGDTTEVNNKLLGFYVGTGYYLPTNKSFRNNYQRRFFVGESSIPATLLTGLKLNIYRNFALGASIMTSKNRYDSYQNMSLRILNGSITFHYQKKISSISTEMSFGPTKTWNTITTQYYGSDEWGQPVLRDGRQTYKCNGFTIGTLAHIAINKWMSIGPFVAYYKNTSGAIEEGGLGSLSGILAGVSTYILE